MRYAVLALLSCCFLAKATTASADDVVGLDCSQKSLADAVRDVRDDRRTIILFTGICAGPITIRTDGLTIIGVSPAIIDGGGSDAVTVSGAGRVSLAYLEVRNGLNGIHAVNGAHLTLAGVTAHDNAVSGISLQTASSAALFNVAANDNGAHGLDVGNGAAATVGGSLTATGNHFAGLNVNGSTITFSQATVVANGNALGVQIAGGANAIISDPATVINADHNVVTGLRVAGARMLIVGGTFNASDNPVSGVSVKSNGGLDLDATATLNSAGNGDGVVVQDGSVLSVFNTPQLSGLMGFSTLNVHNNTGNGVRVLTGSTLALTSQGRVMSTQNSRTGLVADNGVGITLVNATITGNTTKDLQMTFGARADLQTLVFGTYTCDATVLVRGTSGIVCPH
jgi:Right handed beta helix region